ncbi:ABC transporter ATP-binding protein [Marininema halotolerans]|uniref:ABC-2 type transport system ATP-binding protein n=1 Tax=Marininema halotolerans TaxID=1155944 RepID=A0A1I6RNE8_9BACL|nr:ABC transporter ATP-binding protein [Marininema halotolerans]SFS66184.1 ABC-2 type transport system ATP-binding protein [Marininema halotolerans]
MSQKPVLHAQGLTKVIGNKKLVNNIDLTIYPGEIFGFLGPNGAGKTTTIRMLVGLADMTAGKVTIAGYDLEKHFEKAISHVGGIVENPEMYKFLTGYQNLIHYWRMCKGVPKSRIDEVVNQVGLEKRIHDKVKTYSLGMRQRLGIAQALLHSPSLLILDEPTNGLDPKGVKEMREHLLQLAREENMAVLVSSHQLAEMELMCDRIGIIQNGSLIGVKEMREFRDEPTRKIRIIADPIQKAHQLLQQFLNTPVEQQDHALIMEVEHEKIPDINHFLVNENIKIYAIMHINQTLEDRFLEMTGGNSIA